MLYRMPDSDRSREEGLVLLLHNYMLPCVIMLPYYSSFVMNNSKLITFHRFLYVLYHFQYNTLLLLITCFLLSPIATL